MSIESGGLITQLSFIDRPRFYDPEPIRIGSSAEAVLLSIIKTNPRIRNIAYIAYDPDTRSDLEMPIWPKPQWIDVVGLNAIELKRLGTQVSKKRKHPALAICSKVSLENGDMGHIPMLDFTIEKAREIPSEVFELIGSRRGAVLETDVSYHFWGYELLTEEEWRNWIKYCLDFEIYRLEDDTLIDVAYVDRCLKKGYGALRLYSYPGKKEVAPEVRGIVDY